MSLVGTIDPPGLSALLIHVSLRFSSLRWTNLRREVLEMDLSDLSEAEESTML